MAGITNDTCMSVTALCSESSKFRKYLFKRFYVQKVLYSEDPMFRRPYVQKKMFKRSYIQKVLCSEGPIFRYIEKVLYSEHCLFYVGKYDIFQFQVNYNAR